MRLYKVREAVTWTDPFGDKHANLTKYVRVFEVVEATVVEQDPEHQIMLDNGYEPPYKLDVYGLPDGRRWAEITDHVSYSPNTWYKPLFDERKDPVGLYDQADEYNIGPRIAWLTESGMRNRRCVNKDGEAVDIEGNLL